MKVSEDVWKFYQQHLGYTDEEMKEFKENPRNQDIVSKAPALMNKTIVIEVVDSHGCNSQHKVGDKFYFDGGGNLLTKLCPKRICFGALASMGPLKPRRRNRFSWGRAWSEGCRRRQSKTYHPPCAGCCTRASRRLL